MNQNPENDNDYGKSKFVPGDKLYSEAEKHSSTSNNSNIVVFGDSIPNFSRKCKCDFNRNIIFGRARFKHFPGATSKDLLCYVDATLQDATYDARTIIHVGVNDILNNQSHNQTAQLISNLREIIAKCKSYGVKHVFVSGLLHTSKIKENLLVDINRMIKELCMSDGSEYIDNDNIPRDMLYKDGLHLLDKGKYFLSQRFAWKR